MIFRNILLIDDDEEDLEIFLIAVGEVSDAVTCTCVNDAAAALAKLDEGKILPDVIFLDLNMPVMNGQQFLATIKQNEKLQSIPVIIFTTSSDPQTIALTKSLGAHDFITKPEHYDELVSTLALLIN